MKFIVTLILCFLPVLAFASAGTATVGQSVTVTVTSDGTPPLRYQWQKNGSDIQGSSDSTTFTIASCTLADAGVYTVRVWNSAGQVISDKATLTVVAVVPPPSVLPPTKATTTLQISQLAGAH